MAISALAPAPAPTAPPVITPSAATPLPAPESGEVVAAPEPPSVAHVQVSAVEYSFSLSRTIVPAGKVDVEFVNAGQDEHNLNIASLEGPLAGFFGDTPSKGVDELELNMQPGEYTLYCSLPDHEAKGMKATLVVE